MKRHPISPTHRIWPTSALALLTATLALGQSASSTEGKVKIDENDDVVELSEFVVKSSTKGEYYSSNTATAMRTNTAIKDTPIAIEVITREFIQDVNAFDLSEILGYAGAVQVDETAVSADINGTSFRIRGLRTSTLLKNGFARPYRTDSATIDRVDVSKGPTSLLYGTGAFSGVVNYMSRVPKQRPEYSVAETAGSWDSYRTEANATGPLGKKFSYNVAGVYQRRGGEADYNVERSKVLNPIIYFQPTKNTTVSFEYEYFRVAASIADNPISINDTSTTFGVWDGFGQRRMLAVPNYRTFRWSGPDAQRKFFYDQYQFVVRQTVTKDFEIQGGYSYIKRDTNSRSLTPSVVGINAGPAVTDAATRLLARSDGQILRFAQSDNWQHLTQPEARIEGLYKFKLGATSHRFLGGTYYRTNVLKTNGGSTSFTTALLASFTPSQWASTFRSPTDYTSIKHFDPTLPLNPANNVKSTGWAVGQYLAYQGIFFKNHLYVLAGLRRDRSAGRTETRVVSTGAYTDTRTIPRTSTMPTLGASYSITNNLSAYYMRGTAVNPLAGYVDGDGKQMNDLTASSDEVGVKLDINRMVSAQAAVYRISRKDRAVSDAYAYNNVSGTTGYTANVATDDRAEGFDITTTLHPFKPWQIVLNYGHVDTVVTRVAPYVTPTKGQTPGHTGDYRVGLHPEDAAKDIASMWNRIDGFGRLRGWQFGLGATYTGPRLYEITPANPDIPPTTRNVAQRFSLQASAGYRFKLTKKIPLNLQLNLYNLLDDEARYGNVYNTPINYRLSLSTVF